MNLNIHSILWKSKANGPGTRIVIWFQGCSIRCSGCFNPLTHSGDPFEIIEPQSLAERIRSQSAGISGITISGGEPFDQLQGLAELIMAIRITSDLPVILFSGYTLGQIRLMAGSSQILELIDVLIAGPYKKINRQLQNPAGSTHKTFHFFTDRYSPADFEKVPDAEVFIDPDGKVVWSGIAGR